ncbi:MAG: large subunit ribosomal protein [Pseudonocardiales bacterium]|nr:large subunit ribosomal protein [Pseudonocardiales bacterium]MDT7593846.1 large subunit ribosomal protein [Pseudonocardiales bacterium]MDT7629935.1 large subunit ribosomal protein [Pseudonocardiales bacterium]MDT7677187.1 large subunit ribosomal protein [Pseudonocardiales bacterium]MDT7747752.1 large subunit ribosomal protein [Pseudonocardiales bacterium]
MAEVRINAEPRTEFGKGAARRTRRAGQIPAVLYGRGSEPVHLALPALDFARALRDNGRNAVLTIALEGGPQLALPKTVVTHPIRDYIEHVDLLVIKRGEKVVVEVSVHVVGDAVSGALITQELDRLEVEADVSSIPDSLEVSIEGVQIGTQILAGQVPLPDGVNLRTDAEYLVVNVVASPTAEAMEGEVDAEGAGVVEDAPTTSDDN